MKVKTRRSNAVVETDLVSMSDIAFQLIFFFMITTQFMKDSKPVNQPELPRTTETEAQYSVAVDGDGKIYFDGAPVASASELTSRLAGLIGEGASPEKREVRLRVDRNLTQRDFREVEEAISNAGGVLAIMHETPASK